MSLDTKAFSPFNYPEIESLFSQLLDSLLEESGRGAILIATEHVSDFLTKLIIEVMPKDITADKRNSFFKYPGPLSSFSAKIEMAYVFRLINKSLYDSLHSLRKIRNDAAHSAKGFELHELNEKVKNVYKLGPEIPDFIKEKSMNMLIKSKVDILKELCEENGITDIEDQNKVRELLFREETMKKLEKQLPFWELINGLCLICGIIMFHKEKVGLITKDMRMWSDLTNKQPL